MRTPNSVCEICGKQRYRHPSELRKAKHICCRTCRSMLYKSCPEIVKNLDKGWGWNKGMSKKNGDILVYGKPRSQATKELISKRTKEELPKQWAHKKYSDTDIERILEEWLKSKGIKYEKQKQLLGITLVDFFIEPNICLYADGDYWHSLPKRKQSDGLIRKILRDSGYRTIWLKGSEIKAGVRPHW